MPKEIEVKLLYKNKNAIIKKLRQLGAKQEKKIILNDAYFSVNNSSMKNTDNLLRIRQKNNKSELTFKGECKIQKDIWERIELTTNIEDPKAMTTILLSLGIKKLKENSSIRESWTLNNTEILFIKYSEPARLELIEIEGKNKKQIEHVIKSLEPHVTRAGEEIFSIFDKKK